MFNYPKYIYEEPSEESVLQYMGKRARKNAMFRRKAFLAVYRAWLRTRAGEAQNWKCCWCGCSQQMTTSAGNSKKKATRARRYFRRAQKMITQGAKPEHFEKWIESLRGLADEVRNQLYYQYVFIERETNAN